MKKEEIIPAGMRAASFTLEGNKMTIFFEPEKYVPKVGDLVKNISTKDSNRFVIFAFKEFSRHGESINFGDYLTETGLIKDDGEYCFNPEFSIFQKLTPEEFQAEFGKLGYVYDFETHTAHKKRWRAEVNGKYFLVNTTFGINKQFENGDIHDDMHYEAGNYFMYRAEAEVYRDYMLQHSLNFHKQ